MSPIAPKLPISPATCIGQALLWCSALLVVWLGAGMGCGVHIECRNDNDCKAPARFCALGLCKECFADADCRRSTAGNICDPKSFRCTNETNEGNLPEDASPSEPPPPSCTPGTQEACYDGPAATRSRGICRDGMRTCLAIGQWSPCAGQVLPKSETCDGIDNNCNGQTDEGISNCDNCTPGDTEACFTVPASQRNKGECKDGQRTCNVARRWGFCTDEVKPTPEVCDGKDNDCDGNIDESISNCLCPTEGAIQTCIDTKNPQCSRGVQRCEESGRWGTCETQAAPTPEICDGKDNDCDGRIDDNPTDAPNCPIQIGVCAGAHASCVGGAWQPCEAKDYNKNNPAHEAKETLCDGKDNDCNGMIDEGLKDCVSTIAGNGQRAYTDGKGLAAAFNSPTSMVFDKAGLLYLSDSGNHTIRTINFKNQTDVSGFAGSIASGNTDAMGSAARFNQPNGILFYDATTMYVADTRNHRIREVDNKANVTTIAGALGTTPRSGYKNGMLKDALFSSPQGLATDGTSLFIADTGNNAIRKIDNSGMVTTIAGTCTTNCSKGFKDGLAQEALFSGPTNLAFDASGNLLIVDAGNHCIRMLNKTFTNVTTFAGTCGNGGFLDGAIDVAQFNTPLDLVIASDQTIFLTDKGNHRIRFIVGKQVKTLAGKTGGFRDGPTSTALFNAPAGIVLGPQDELYISETGNNRIRRITPK